MNGTSRVPSIGVTRGGLHTENHAVYFDFVCRLAALRITRMELNAVTKRVTASG
jgi:hypothetical protein